MIVTVGVSTFWSVGKSNPFIKRRIAGIYAIRNLMNQKLYVGSAVSIYDRLYNHVWHLESGTHHNPKLLNAWRKYKPAAFSLEVLEIVETPKSLIEREQFWIERLNAIASGYNLSPNAGSNLGLKLCPDARKAVADGARKAMADPIIKARHREATKGAMRDPEVKQKCSEHLRKRWQDPVARSFLMKSRWSDPEARQKQVLRLQETNRRIPLEKKRELAIKNFQISLERKRQIAAENWAKRGNLASFTRARHYRVIYPDGQISSIFNLKQFCQEHSIPYPSAMNVLNGRVRQAKGYVFERMEK